jgi:hypothetical protein
MNRKEQFTPAQRVKSLVLITPIKQGFLPHCPAIRYGDRLGAVLQGISDRQKEGKPNALDLIESVHFGQWTIIDGGQRLLFVSMYVGELEPYLKDFSVRVAWGLDLIWTNCEEYPGAARFEEFVGWVKRHMSEAGCFYASNPDVTVIDIKWWKGLHRQFEEFRRDVHCGASIGPRFAELERGLSRLSAHETNPREPNSAEPSFLDSLEEGVLTSIEELEKNGLFTQEELKPIKENFNQMTSNLNGERAR